MRLRVQRSRELERWVAWIRVGAVVFAVVQVAIGGGYPSGYRFWAWLTTVLFAVGTLVLFWLARRSWSDRAQIALGMTALAFDLAVVAAFVLIYSFEQTGPIRQLVYLPLIEAAVRFGIPGAILLTAASVPLVAGSEWLR
jgi:hypothetical protein